MPSRSPAKAGTQNAYQIADLPDQANSTTIIQVVGGAALGGDLEGTLTDAQIAAGAVGTTELANDAVTAAKLADTTVTPGTVTLATITVDQQGRITAASSGIAAYTGHAYELIAVNSSGNGLTFVGIAANYVLRMSATGFTAGTIIDDGSTCGVGSNAGVGRFNAVETGTAYHAIYVRINNGSASLSAGYFDSNGGGATVEANMTGTASAMRGQIQNSSNAAPAIEGLTNGSGAAVRGEATAAGGTGLQGSGDIAVDLIGGFKTTPTLVTATSYTVATDDYIIHHYLTGAGAGCTDTLPSLSTVPVGRQYIFRDIAHNAGTRAITIQRAGSDTFTDGNNSTSIATSGYSRVVECVDIGSGTKRWHAVQ